MVKGSRGRRGWRHVGLTAVLAGSIIAVPVPAFAAADRAPQPLQKPVAVVGQISPPRSGQIGPTRAEQISPVRQTEVEAVSAAKASGARVEILAFREEQREVYANPDGTFTADEHTTPVRTLRSGKWVDVDPNLVPSPDGTLTPKATGSAMRLSGGGDEPLIRVDRAGRQLALRWLGDLPAPKVDGSRATYAGVLPGVDLAITVSPSGFSHVLVVNDANAARDPRLRELRFGLETEGLNVTPDAEGGLVAKDAVTGMPVFEGGEPTMWDSSKPADVPRGTPTPRRAAGANDPAAASALHEPDVIDGPSDSAKVAKVGVRVDGGSLTLTPNVDLLTAIDTRYPVAIDPVWTDTSRSGWAMVDSGYPTEEYWRFDDEKHERIGSCPDSCYSSVVKRLFYALPTPYAGKTILSATFRVTMVRTYDDSARAMSLYRMPAGIHAGTNWNNQPGGKGAWPQELRLDTRSPTRKQAECTATNQNVELNATKAVQDAVKNRWATTTFGLRADNERSHPFMKRFCDNAILSVHYNRAPDTPRTSEMTMSPGGGCVSGDARPSVDAPPRLFAVLRDPDQPKGAVEQLSGQFKVYWPAAAPTVTRLYPVNVWKSNGSTFSVALPDDLPENVVIGWEVQATDDRNGKVWSPWSSSGQSRCEFVFDRTQPAAPDIDSPEYLPNDAADTTSDCKGDDAAWRGSIGVYGTFTFDSPASDVKEYIYGFNTNPMPGNKLSPTSDGGPVSTRWVPDSDGPQWVTVQAVDRANKRSPIAICHFRVATRTAVGQWALNEAVGSSSAADSNGGEHKHSAAAGRGVVFGVPGPGGRTDFAARLDGSTDGFLQTASSALVDTRRSFAVSAWVRLADDKRNAVAVSQDGSGQAGFSLGYDAATKRWTFLMPTSDVMSLGNWSVSAGPALMNEWTHLVGVYDGETSTISLHVNDGSVSASAPRRSAWKSRGGVQIGRARTPSGYIGHWTGDLADVTVFDRMVARREVGELYHLVPVRSGYWLMNELTQGSTPEHDGGAPLTVTGGPVLYKPDLTDDPFAEPALVGAGHLEFDGVDDHASTPGPVALTDRSFTISARVRLAGNGCGRDMAVVSQAGAHSSGFVVRCSVDNRWQLTLPTEDKVGAAVDEVADDQVLPGAANAGTHLAVVYNAFTNQMQLYVNGQLADSAQGHHNKVWQAAGGFQVARVRHDGAWGQYFAGVIDDVRVYEGAADATLVQRLAIPTELTGL
ncbi:MAG TPA: LamG-like jellyroll fold domain-containing protein [Catenuloplanes sp.]